MLNISYNTLYKLFNWCLNPPDTVKTYCKPKTLNTNANWFLAIFEHAIYLLSISVRFFVANTSRINYVCKNRSFMIH